MWGLFEMLQCDEDGVKFGVHQLPIWNKRVNVFWKLKPVVAEHV